MSLENVQYIDSASISNLVVTSEMVTTTLSATSISCSVITASLHFGTASYAFTSSYSLNGGSGGGSSVSASWASSSISASYLSGSTAIVTNLTTSAESVVSLIATRIFTPNAITNLFNTATNTNAIGYTAGNSTSGDANNFLGYYAGIFAGGVSNVNFIGNDAGAYATSANYSNFIGYNAGYNAYNASSSIMIGYNVGYNAYYANSSIFIGYNAGNGSNNANNSIFIGYNAGNSDVVNNSSGPYSSILIGDYTSTGGWSNSIAIGRGTKNSTGSQCNIGNSLFINGIYTGSTSTSSSQIGVKVGIGNNNPTNSLDVIGNISCSVITASLFYGTASYSLTGGSGGGSSVSASWASQSLSSSYSIFATTASYFSAYSGSSQIFLQSTDGFTYPVTLTTDGGTVVLTVGQTPLSGSNGFINIGYVYSGSAISASYAGTASYGITSSYLSGSAISSSYSLTASYALNGGSGGSTVSASWASQSLSASYLSGSAISSSYSLTASYALNGGGSGGSTVSASWASQSLSASYLSGSISIVNALTASSALIPILNSTSITASTLNFGPLMYGSSTAQLNFRRGDNTYPAVNVFYYDGANNFLGGYSMDSNYGNFMYVPSAQQFLYVVNLSDIVANVQAGTLTLLASGHQPNYSVIPTNMLTVNGNIFCSVITASLFYGTASYANSSSYSLTASYALNGGSGGGSTVSASWASQSLSASYLSGTAVSTSYAGTASYGITSSYFSGSTITASVVTALNFFALDGITYNQYIPTGSLVPDIYFTGSSTTGSDSVMGIYQTVSTGSSIGIIINMASFSSGSAIAISASAGSIIATQFSGSLYGSSSYAITASYVLPSSIQPVTVISSSYTASVSDYNIICINTASIGIYLTSSLSIGQHYNIKKYNASSSIITVSPSNGTIDGQSTMIVAGSYSNMEIINVGSGNWAIL